MILEQYEGDARAYVAAGAREEPVQEARQALDEALVSEVKSKRIDPAVARLNRALGVA